MVCCGLGESVNLNACGFGSVSNGHLQGGTWLPLPSTGKLSVGKCFHFRFIFSVLTWEVSAEEGLSSEMLRLGSSCCGSVVNLTSMHEDVGSSPSLTQYAKDPVLP